MGGGLRVGFVFGVFFFGWFGRFSLAVFWEFLLFNIFFFYIKRNIYVVIFIGFVFFFLVFR